MRALDKLNWHHKNPFVEEFRVTKEDIDILGHVNNKVYLNWCETVSWNHSASLGITSKTYEELKCACVVIKSEKVVSSVLMMIHIAIFIVILNLFYYFQSFKHF